MVMGPTHAWSGVAAGLGAVHLVPTLLDIAPPSAPTAITFAALTAGAAILPDLDHPNATATKALGPITRVISELIQRLSRVIYLATRSHHDHHRGGGHRGITHTTAGALIAAALVGAACAWGGPLGLILPLFLVLTCALRALPPENGHGADLVAASILTGLAVWLVPSSEITWWFGGAVALGCLVHALGDAVTDMGVPLLWPLPIGGRRWRPVGPPRILRFKASGPGDKAVMILCVAASLVLGFALLPWGWQPIYDAWDWTTSVFARF